MLELAYQTDTLSAYRPTDACSVSLHQVAQILRSQPRVLDAWATGQELAVRLRPRVLPERIQSLVSKAVAVAQQQETLVSNLLTLPVRYDGPDLEEVATQSGLARSEVIRLHQGAEYAVESLGFQPGFAYLSGLSPKLVLPRRATPRRQVPAQSLAIAGAHSAVYPHASPGGWHLLGTVLVPVFQPKDEFLSVFRPGQRVRFQAVSG